MTDKHTTDFILAHRDDEVRTLALRFSRDKTIDLPAVLEQIAGWQTARRKIPSWAATEGIAYPPRLSMEQCSGEKAALYKAGVVRRITKPSERTLLTDLTGGAGVDFAFMAPLFQRAVYVERQERLCRTAIHNMRVLGINHARIICADATAYIRNAAHSTVIFIDPARRDSAGRRTYAISDCAPDVLAMENLLIGKARVVMLKLSPMLDLSKTIQDLNANEAGNVVREAHIVAVDNECKELLMVLSADYAGSTKIFCSDNDHVFSYGWDDNGGHPPRKSIAPQAMESGMYVYVPSVAVMKAGCFPLLCSRFGVEAVGPNSHVFLSPKPVEGFPGRRFRASAVASMNKKELRQVLQGVERANITVRNFPLTADGLRQRIRIPDGGDTYLIATTAAKRHIIIVTHKA